MSRIILGNQLESILDREQEFVDYEAERAKSSRVAVLPQEGAFIKEKDRTFQKAFYELFLNYLWENLLPLYDPAIHAPSVIGLDYEGFKSRILTRYIDGTPLSHICNSKSEKIRFKDREIRRCSLAPYLAGKLNRIKECECLVHGDYQLRHLLLANSDDKLYAIDLENAGLGTPEEVAEENGKLVIPLLARFSDKTSRILYQEGYNEIAPKGIYQDVYKETFKKFIDLLERQGEDTSVLLGFDFQHKKPQWKKKN